MRRLCGLTERLRTRKVVFCFQYSFFVGYRQFDQLSQSRGVVSQRNGNCNTRLEILTGR